MEKFFIVKATPDKSVWGCDPGVWMAEAISGDYLSAAICFINSYSARSILKASR